MRVIIRDESLEASEYVAGYIVERVKEFDPSPDRPFVLGLPTGSSPLGVYKALVRKYKAGQVRKHSSFPRMGTSVPGYAGLSKT